MAVKQHIRRLAARGLDVAHDHRPAGGRTLGRFESEIAQLRDQPVRGPLAVREMRGNGGNRGDRQKSEQPIERRLLAGVDGGKNIVNRSHLRWVLCGVSSLNGWPYYHDARNSSSGFHRFANDGLGARPLSILAEARGIYANVNAAEFGGVERLKPLGRKRSENLAEDDVERAGHDHRRRQRQHPGEGDAAHRRPLHAGAVGHHCPGDAGRQHVGR